MVRKDNNFDVVVFGVARPKVVGSRIVSREQTAANTDEGL
ncbi:hypothetical protein C499_16914 [Halogeometricum borinquense DSM 11551]|uniref:Uncharacterized protein n=1 Tax=Halogeometricum borinquense (strain ATCC 700274 / DSM 11551 / JCM 10706 / KCTC 4070 / PR3) TaxID=469382 RepID=E4NQR9_HALBP|nr:hypothetical protein Hbor_23060 [Halogeometricum borinquense DSM 11551]ELY23452.1 hypothetical protein C499_16914 [Halogeometricum borinquense DSM 11551]